MAYQNVSTPRFYINHPLWALSNGVDEFTETPNTNISVNEIKKFVYLVPSIKTIGGNMPHAINYPDNGYGFNYFMFLGHNFVGDNQRLHLSYAGVDFNTSNPLPQYSFVINAPSSGAYGAMTYNGWSLMGYDDSPTLDIGFQINFTEHIPLNCGSIFWGRYYDMAHSPNLSLSVGCDYGKPKETITHNGSSISNTMWTKSPMWGGKPPWELYEGSMWESPRRSGRRTWDMKFSFLSSSSIFPEVSSINAFESLSPEGLSYGSDLDPLGNTLLDDQTSFFSQVWHKTLGGTLPFIFQPDKDNNNPDQFAICMFKNSSLKIVQSAFQVYDISLSIEEVW